MAALQSTRPSVGGQALPDGVFMRTDRAWAIARRDGSVDIGAMPSNPAGRVPVVRVVVGLVTALGLATRGLRSRSTETLAARRARRRCLLVLVPLAVLGFVSPDLGVGHASLASRFAMAIAVLLGSLGLLRVALPGALWRFHGAEHKAVSAHEAHSDLDDISAVMRATRLHNRCGTNLAFLMVVVAVPLLPLPLLLQVPAFLLAIGAVAEVMTIAARRPSSPLTRVLLFGGRQLQRFVTTAEPSPAEQLVGCRALLACLAEHERLVADQPLALVA
ncbi:MAG: hypothetical protein JWO37_3686 [Acidimicrobiales bacterium]|jgi:uncharacterized protein YqhQ|nr:hypothetical protein [Acidimicrobiales bacterium]